MYDRSANPLQFLYKTVEPTVVPHCLVHFKSKKTTSVCINRTFLATSHVKRAPVTRYKYSMIWQKLAFSSSVVSFSPSYKFHWCSYKKATDGIHVLLVLLSNDFISRIKLLDYIYTSTASGERGHFVCDFCTTVTFPLTIILCYMYKKMSLL